jgi:ABC-type oligopeptide transport system substrate-binding subunit
LTTEAFEMVAAILRAVAVAAAVCLSVAAHAHADPAKVLRVSSKDIASLDPQQGTDLRSTRAASAIFEGLYQFDYLADPAKVVPSTAKAMPVITGGGKVWTIKLLRGIHFTDSQAFKGKPCELIAEDYVYSIKRSLDPNLLYRGDPALTDLIEGARPIVDAASKPGANRL